MIYFWKTLIFIIKADADRLGRYSELYRTFLMNATKQINPLVRLTKKVLDEKKHNNKVDPVETGHIFITNVPP